MSGRQIESLLRSNSIGCKLPFWVRLVRVHALNVSRVSLIATMTSEAVVHETKQMVTVNF